MAHSKYGPSSINRVVLCPGCILAVDLMIEQKRIPEKEPDSPWAISGTQCHDAVYEINENNRYDLYNALSDEQKGWVDYALQATKDLTFSMGSDFIKGGPITVNEKEVSMGSRTEKWPEKAEPMFGTLDRGNFAIHNGHLMIIDYKFGRGEVQAEENDQLQAYAFMAIESWIKPLLAADSTLPEVNDITLVIIQPRVSEKIKTWKTDVAGLETWWKTRICRAVKRSVGHNPPRIPSKDACRYCRAKGRCEAQQMKYPYMVKKHPVDELRMEGDRDRINSLALQLEEFKIWYDAMQELVLEFVKDDVGLLDFKAVRGRAPARAWVNETKADSFLRRQGMKKDERTITKLISPAQAEKKLKKLGASAKAWTSFHNNVEKKEGKITFALNGDPRPAIEFDDKKDALEAMDAQPAKPAAEKPVQEPVQKPTEKHAQQPKTFLL